jgi:hypothetical protein
MKKEWILWIAAMILGISLSVGGCGEKENDSDSAQSRMEVAPSSSREKPAPDDTLAPSDGSNQNLSWQEQDTGGEPKSQPG